MRRTLHIVLALALLLFSWAELAHATDLDAHPDGQSCEVCILAAHLGHGAPSAGLQLPLIATQEAAPPQTATPDQPQSFRHTLGQRGPPVHA